MDEAGIYAGIAFIVGSVISFFIPDTTFPKKYRDAQERIARIWGITPRQAKIVECAGLA